MPTIVVKYGGSAMGTAFEQVLDDVVTLHHLGYSIVLVHGGGKEISMMLERLGMESRFVEGLRVTDEATMQVVEMVLAGSVNKRIVGRIQAKGVQAVGLTGVDGGLLQAAYKDREVWGYVGDVVQVEADFIKIVSAQNAIPVVAPIGLGENGERLNINADSAAGALAAALQADALYMLTDVPGIRLGHQGETSIAERVTARDIRTAIQAGEIYGGMIPKVDACLQALAAGASEVHIIDGGQPGILVKRVLGEPVIGTVVVADEASQSGKGKGVEIA